MRKQHAPGTGPASDLRHLRAVLLTVTASSLAARARWCAPQNELRARGAAGLPRGRRCDRAGRRHGRRRNGAVTGAAYGVVVDPTGLITLFPPTW